jgi:hypothetical protein
MLNNCAVGWLMGGSKVYRLVGCLYRFGTRAADRRRQHRFDLKSQGTQIKGIISSYSVVAVCAARVAIALLSRGRERTLRTTIQREDKMKSFFGKLVVTAGALMCTLTIGASRAAAETITYSITSDHCSGSGGCLNGGSGGTISVTSNIDGSLTFTVNLAPGMEFHNGGQDVDLGFELSGVNEVKYSGLNADWQIPTTALAGDGGELAQLSSGNPTLHADGTGFFDYGIQLIKGVDLFNSPFSFTISGVGGGLTLANLVENPSYQFFAMDVLGNGNTGFVDASVLTSDTPDGGATAVLLGLGLLGLALTSWRRSHSL